MTATIGCSRKRTLHNRTVGNALKHGLLFSFLVLAQPFAAAASIKSAPIESAQNAVLFSSSFEALPNATIDLSSARPANGSSVSAALDTWVGITFTVQGAPEPGVVALMIDGVDVTKGSLLEDSRVSYALPAPLSAGAHQVLVRVGTATAEWSFNAVPPPQISEFLPSNVTLAANALPEISAHFVDASVDIDAGQIALSLDGVSVREAAVIEWLSPRDGIISYQVSTPLSEGAHIAQILVANATGAARPATTIFSVAPAVEYILNFNSPVDGSTVTSPELTVQLVAGSNATELLEVEINDEPGIVVSHSLYPRPFAQTRTLQPGLNTLTAVAHFANGEERSQSIDVHYDAPPLVMVTQPVEFASFGPVNQINAGTPGNALNLTGAVQRPISLTGTLSRPVMSVTINQQQALLSADRMAFSFANFFLHEGTNLLSVNAIDEMGRSGSAQRTVYVDQTAPLLQIEGPVADAITSAATVDVRGIVNDAIEPGYGIVEPSVTVLTPDGALVQAEVSDRYFIARDVPIELGQSELTVQARDSFGNTRIQSTDITRISAGSDRLTLLSGDRQVAQIDSVAEHPFEVVALRADGLPWGDAVVHFDVLRGSGSLRLQSDVPTLVDGLQAARNLEVATDASGQARVWMKLGREAGASGNMLRAWIEGSSDEVIFTATGSRTAPAWVLVNGMAGAQYAQTSSQPVEALSVVVIDSERNAIPAIGVQFSIELGDARFTEASAPGGVVDADGATFTVMTDRNGVASARPFIGPSASTVHVRARAVLENSLFGAADFQIIVLERKAGPTQFSGVVMDHAGLPLEGVILSIGRTSLSALSDVDGKFLFENQVPEGKIDLHVDGTALRIERAGQTLQYPGLHFETAIVQGQLNQLPHPIYLPSVNLAQAQIVGGNEDVRLTIPGMDGFAMIVKANSVTFPDGSRQGPLVVTPVNGDRLPMVPPGGFATFGALAWTIQPTGTRFDPPIEVHIPNTSGLRRGDSLPIVQWDHDLATFVPMGRGTVSEDATRIVSDPGSGITKAGWGGGPPPVPPNCGTSSPPSCRGAQCSDCPDCQVRGQAAGQQCPSCRPDLLKLGKECNTNNYCRRCNSNGSCVPDPTRFPEGSSSSVTEIDYAPPRIQSSPLINLAEFHGYRNDPNPKAVWDFEIDAYCTPAGKWKFKLTKARIESVIVVNSNTVQRQITLTDILFPLGGSQQAQCDYLDGSEFQMRWVASTHYFSGGAYNSALNPDIAAIAPQMNKASPNFFDAAGVMAHEQLHFRRYKRYTDLAWQDFESKIGLLEADMRTYPNKAAARSAPHIERSFENAIIELANDSLAERVSSGGFGDHAPPDDFYGCALNAMAPLLNQIDVQRTAIPCTPRARPALSCPN